MKLQCLGLLELWLTKNSHYFMLHFKRNPQPSEVFNEYWVIYLLGDINGAMHGVDFEHVSHLNW